VRTWFSRYDLEYRPDSRRSSEGAKKVRPPACPRGTMLIFCTGSYSGISAPTSAWPACATAIAICFGTYATWHIVYTIASLHSCKPVK
jgi:hypothetical protein